MAPEVARHVIPPQVIWYRSFPRDRVKVELQDGLAAHREQLDKLTQANVHNLFAYLASLK
jgi:cytochrome c oxidase cbb3-type subunit 3